jgi:hypothetical protein
VKWVRKNLFAVVQEEVEAEVLWDVEVLVEVVGRGELEDLPSHALLELLYVRLRRVESSTSEVSRYKHAMCNTLAVPGPESAMRIERLFTWVG